MKIKSNRLPLISIVMPCFNSAQFVADAINSVTNQSYKNWELIVVDDNSTDDTVRVVSAFEKKNRKIKLIKCSSNGGTAGARNNALDIASGDFIAFLDSDDLWDQNFLEEMYYFASTNKFKFCYASCRVVDFDSNKTLRSNIVSLKCSYLNMLHYNHIPCLSAFVSRDLIGGQRMKDSLAQDYIFWLQLLKKIDFAYGNVNILATYRVRKNSISRNKIKMLTSRWQIYRNQEELSFFTSLIYLLSFMKKMMVRYVI